MPPAVRFTREAILNAALSLVRKEGPEALNARSVARELGGSTQPIFRIFTSMDQLRSELIRVATERCRQQLMSRITSNRDAYLEMGMGYVLFARDEPQLFKLLFLRDRTSPNVVDAEVDYAWAFETIQRSTGYDLDTAKMLYERTWSFIHGLATSFATKYAPFISEDKIRALLTEGYSAAALINHLPEPHPFPEAEE